MRVFITGITGTLGTALAKLHRQRGHKVYGCARSERTGARWLTSHFDIADLFITDCRSLSSNHTDIGRLLPTMDRLYHCAAMKHVELCEQSLMDCYQQNVSVTQTVATACSYARVPMIFISSDKACMAQGAYGATKLMGEKIVLRHHGSVMRLGNLIGSSGSVFERWKKAIEENRPIHLTDPEMTRYFIGVEDAARFIADHHHPNAVSIPDPMLSVCMLDVAELLRNKVYGSKANTKLSIVGMRPGETLHQWLVAPGDRVSIEEYRIILSSECTSRCVDGMNSLTAARWKPEDLLRIAGVLP